MSTFFEQQRNFQAYIHIQYLNKQISAATGTQQASFCSATTPMADSTNIFMGELTTVTRYVCVDKIPVFCAWD